MKTWAEYKAAGYRVVGSAFARGYVSRKIDVNEQEIKVAGGSRKGQLYYEAPTYLSTQYHKRVYIAKIA